jgi:hypothetical protein
MARGRCRHPATRSGAQRRIVLAMVFYGDRHSTLNPCNADVVVAPSHRARRSASTPNAPRARLPDLGKPRTDVARIGSNPSPPPGGSLYARQPVRGHCKKVTCVYAKPNFLLSESMKWQEQ